MYFFTTYLFLVIGIKSIQGGFDESYDFSIGNVYYDTVSSDFVNGYDELISGDEASVATVRTAKEINLPVTKKSSSDFSKLALKNYKSAVCYRSKMEKLLQVRNRLQKELQVLQKDCSQN